MLKRMEVYADTALLSFPCALIVFALFIALGVIRGSLNAAALSLPAGLLAIPLVRLLHRATLREPLARNRMLSMSLYMLGSAAAAGVLLSVSMASNWVALWIVMSVFVLALAVAMVGDAVYDLIKARDHKVIDVLRILLIGFLGAAALSGGPAGMVSAESGPWIVGVSGYMLLVAAAASGVDLLIAWRAHHGEDAHSGLVISP